MNLKFVVPGPPQGQGRPRFARQGNLVKTYDPAQSRDYKNFVRMLAIQELKTLAADGEILPCENSCSLCITAYFPIPKSTTKKFKQMASDDHTPCAKKPDIDNISKIVMDALNGIAYKDDKQITELHVLKYYSQTPRLEIWLHG